jgi:hypothetical protein
MRVTVKKWGNSKQWGTANNGGQTTFFDVPRS